MASNDWKDTSKYYSRDPFPEIAPSLLNSADILRYARAGCLVHPFSFDPERHNPATYTLSLLGTLHSWVQEGDSRYPKATLIEVGKTIELEANSISYLETKEEFRLPQYIAARFNLHILHVHRGILLGTGPVVHPGYVGRLLVPLHNLTANPYKVVGGDKLLWVEFTKLTKHPYWCRPMDEFSADAPSELMAFRQRYRNLSAPKFFEKAGVLSQGVISAFKGAVAAVEKRAEASEKASLQARSIVKWLTGAGVLGLAVGIGALIFAAFELFQNNAEMATTIHERLDRIEREIGLLPPKSRDMHAKNGKASGTEQPSVALPATASDIDGTIEDGSDHAQP